VQREQYRGIWLPEPRLGHAETATIDPADQVTLDETVAYALLVAMERLTPAERVSFILHDVFKVPFDEVAATVGRSAAACRQLAVSARRHLEAGPRFDVPSSARDRTVAAFLDACRGGDLQQLAALLDPAVESVADGGDLVRAARRPIVGAVPVATYLLGVLATQKTTTSHPLEFTLEPINGRTGIVIRGGDTVVGTVDLVISDGRISRIAMQVNPEKLQATHD
jgi:RNA polymerase sigma-70 factor (ECF subfamily)